MKSIRILQLLVEEAGIEWPTLRPRCCSSNSGQIPHRYRLGARMTYRLKSVLLAVMAVALFGPIAKANAPKEIRTEKNKPVVLANFLSAPANCGSNPGPVP